MAKLHTMNPNRERRRRRRFPLHCRVQFEKHGQILDGTTVNISSSGFYCLAPEPLQTGDVIRCVVDLVQEPRVALPRKVSLNCEAVVIRSEAVEGGYGVACSIRAYSMAPFVAPRTEARLSNYYQ